MSKTDIARRSDSLYYDKVTRRALCDRIAYLEADMDEMGSVVVPTMLDEGAYLPERAHDTDAGADIKTPVAVSVPVGGSAIVRTGIHVQLPNMTVGMVKSKSGLHINDDITTDGVIDEGYSGEIVVKLHNRGRESKRFEAGEKIAQLVIMPVWYPTYRQVDAIASGKRGANGFGSTGR